MTTLWQILKELFTERTRILLTIFAVAWGTASIATMLAVGEGLRLTFGRAMLNSGNGILIIQGGETSKAYHGHKANEKINLVSTDLNLLKNAIPELKTISTEYSSWHSMQYDKQFRHGSILGVDPSYGVMRNIVLRPGGRFINSIDMQENRRVAVIGSQVAEQLFASNPQTKLSSGKRHSGGKKIGMIKKMHNTVFESSPADKAIGKTIIINQIPFIVIGVTEDKLQFWGYSWPQDNAQTWVPASTYYSLWRPQFVNDFVIIPKNSGQMDGLIKRIQQTIALKNGVSPEDEGILNTQNSQAAQEKTTTLFTGMEFFLGGVGTLTLLIAGVGIANVMYVSVSHATREIGIRMTVGAHSYQILGRYIAEAMLTTLLGGIIGVMLAWSVVELIQLIPMNSDFFVSIGRPRPVLSKMVVFIVIFILGIIGLLAGFFPARKASMINPAEALRYE